MKILLKGGRVIDYKNKIDSKLDILLENEKITKIGKDIEEQVDREIDCKGLNIIPGMIDIHCHLREPGFEYKETIDKQRELVSLQKCSCRRIYNYMPNAKY